LAKKNSSGVISGESRLFAQRPVYSVCNIWFVSVILPPTLIGGGIKRWCCLTSAYLTCVCRVHREQRGLRRIKLFCSRLRHDVCDGRTSDSITTNNAPAYWGGA